MKWNLKLNGLHLFIILIGALVIFSLINPIMEGFTLSQEELTKPAGIQAIDADDKASEIAHADMLESSRMLTENDVSSMFTNHHRDNEHERDNDHEREHHRKCDHKPHRRCKHRRHRDGESSSYIGAAGDTVLVDNPRHPADSIAPNASSTAYSNDNRPLGIPKSEIPSGSEDLYILKSQVIPPVCPACPNISACPRPAPYPPCPPCARCPEPSFECKKVPNYNNPTENSYLPRPVLGNFSQFGM